MFKHPLPALLRAGCWLGTAAFVQACAAPAAPADTPGAGATEVPAPQLGAPQRVATAVGTLAFWDAGSGARVLVLWPSILSDHRQYAAQIAQWRRDYRLIVIDGPGHGASGASPSGFSMAQCARAVAQVLDRAGVRRAAVIGTSWGGLVAGEFALAYPERAVGIAMLNTPFYVAPGGPDFSDRFVAWGARWIHGTRLFSDGVARAFFLPATRQRGGPLLDGFHDHIHAADGAALAQAVRSVLLDRDELAPKLPRIGVPALVVAGTEDGMYPLDKAREAARSLPRGEFAAVNSAHISVVDAPQATQEVVDGFLARLAW